jgi:hypothetical protein
MRWVALLAVGCSALGQATAPQSGPCGDAALAAIVLECRTRKVTECKGIPDESCPLIAECDKRIDDWERCGQ